MKPEPLNQPAHITMLYELSQTCNMVKKRRCSYDIIAVILLLLVPQYALRCAQM